MSSVRPANNWNSFDGESQYWDVEFFSTTPARDLLSWQDVVLGAGERLDILWVDTVAEFSFDRERDGRFSDFVRAHPEKIVPVDDELPSGFALGDTLSYDPRHGVVTSTLLDYVDSDGNLAQTWVQDMRGIGQQVGLNHTCDQPPLRIVGGASSLAHPEPRVGFEFVVTTDIFFPWNIAYGRSGLPPGELIDNTVLAELNGGRLFAYLREIRDAAAAIGGTWTGTLPIDEHPN